MTTINSYTFKDFTGLESITIPDSVTTIGSYAFSGCTSLKSITIPDNVTKISLCAFAGCKSLGSITIPKSVTTIDYGVFNSCTSLREIIAAEENPNYISFDGILYSKDKTMLCRYPGGKEDDSFIIPDSVTEIGGGAFEGCTSLRSISLPSGVIRIMPDTFKNCTGLNEVRISNNVYLFDWGAFENCTSLKSVTLLNDVYNNDTSQYRYINDNGGRNAFKGCTSLERIDFPYALSRIGPYTFQDCVNLRCVTFKGSELTSIYAYAFAGCTSLTHINIPDSVTNISAYAFQETGLTSIIIPEGVKTIGNCIFWNCGSLDRIEYHNKVFTDGKDEYDKYHKAGYFFHRFFNKDYDGLEEEKV